MHYRYEFPTSGNIWQYWLYRITWPKNMATAVEISLPFVWSTSWYLGSSCLATTILDFRSNFQLHRLYRVNNSKIVLPHLGIMHGSIHWNVVAISSTSCDVILGHLAVDRSCARNDVITESSSEFVSISLSRLEREPYNEKQKLYTCETLQPGEKIL